MRNLRSVFCALALASLACLFIPSMALAQSGDPDDDCLYLAATRSSPSPWCFQGKHQGSTFHLSTAIPMENQLFKSQSNLVKESERPTQKDVLKKATAKSPVFVRETEMSAAIKESWIAGDAFPY
jgi:hypothetical protein